MHPGEIAPETANMKPKNQLLTALIRLRGKYSINGVIRLHGMKSKHRNPERLNMQKPNITGQWTPTRF